MTTIYSYSGTPLLVFENGYIRKYSGQFIYRFDGETLYRYSGQPLYRVINNYIAEYSGRYVFRIDGHLANKELMLLFILITEEGVN